MSTAAVARIAYLASDVLITTPASPFTLPSSSSSKAPELDVLHPHADPGLVASRHAGSRLTTILLASVESSSSASPFTRLVPSLSELAQTATVVHVAVPAAGDLSDVVALRSAGWVLVLSSTTKDAHDHAVVASKLARQAKRAVLHVFVESAADALSEAEQVDEAKFVEFLDAPPPAATTNGSNGDHSHSSALFREYELASLATLALLRRPQRPYVYSGPASPSTVFVVFGTEAAPLVSLATGPAAHFGVLEIKLLRPLSPHRLLSALPAGVKNVIVLEQAFKKTTKWGGVYLDVVSAVQDHEGEDERPKVFGGLLGPLTSNSATLTTEVTKLITALGSNQDLLLGSIPTIAKSAPAPTAPHVPALESAYTKMLAQIFGDRLEVANSPDLVATSGASATLPEYAFGKARADIALRAELVEAVEGLLSAYGVDKAVHGAWAKWLLAKDDARSARSLGEQAITILETSDLASSNKAAQRILALRAHVGTPSRWIIGSDAWSYDLGASGVHHAIASGENVNLLVIDSVPYTQRDAALSHKRKKDIGLYAMNHGDVYVASVAVYSSYSQVLQALTEADKFKGPSVVLAYLPYAEESASALEVLKETKLAVDTGYWPLYRWDPSLEVAGKEPFSLDSEHIKNELQEFLDRQSHLSQLTNAAPTLAPELVESLGEKLLVARKDKAKKAYEALLSAFDGPPLLILFASDGGNAQKVAQRLATRAGLRGLATRCIALDEFPLDDLKLESHVAIVTSTAGQGEAPQNARVTFKALAALAAAGEKPFGDVKFSVFGMGDTHYWPRPEDAHYYNKPGKDLDARLEQLGAERMAPLGLGDDQDADGAQTGYKLWEPTLWKAMGVDNVEVTEAEPEPITNEHIKIASNYLRGTIAEGLKDTTTGALSASDGQLTKFHGIYEQDDRDIREERKAAGLEPAYSFMVRVRLPAGVATPAQWLAMDQISDEHGNGTLKMTTRQTWQYHGIIKKHLKPAIQAINRALLDTIAACGDVNRNVQCAANPSKSHLHKQVWQFSKDLSEHLLPDTSAYAEIWLDKKKVAGDAVQDFEPKYGKYYLPRKFKIAVAVPPQNDVDVFTNDVGFIAIVDEKTEQLVGFNVTVGGGMGVTHSNTKTYPRLGDVIGFVKPEEGCAVAEAIMLTQRDNGNRADRKNARLKYTVDRMGLPAFKAEVEKRFGKPLAPERPYKFTSSVDEFGWSQGHDGKHHFTMFIENGRVQDEPEKQFKTGLREIAQVHKGFFRLTANQHVILSDIATEDLPEIKALLAKYKLDNLGHSALRHASSACVAFPTCGLAMAESERYLPLLVDKVEAIMEENGLRNDSIVMRMSGCPNGCSRPWPAEIAFVGKAPGTYMMLLGGGFYGQRLSKLYRESVTEPEILAILRPLIKRWATERHDGEHFGDFVIRIGVIKPTISGKTFYESTSMDPARAIHATA